MSNQGHWVGLKADTKNYFGFIYIIRDLKSGRKYIGKKQFFGARRVMKGCKSKVTDRQSPKWKSCCWREMAWRTYSGSSKSLDKWRTKNPDHEYVHEIIHLCRSKGVLHYMELKEMWDRDVLKGRLSSGEHRYFNRSIGAIKFRPPEFVSKETIKKRSGDHNSNYSDKKKELVHSKSFEVFYGTQVEFRKFTGYSRSAVSGLFSGSSLSLYEWRLSHRLGERCPGGVYDKRQYTFIHKGTGDIFEGTRLEFNSTYPHISLYSISKLLRGVIKSTGKGWRLST